MTTHKDTKADTAGSKRYQRKTDATKNDNEKERLSMRDIPRKMIPVQVPSKRCRPHQPRFSTLKTGRARKTKRIPKTGASRTRFTTLRYLGSLHLLCRYHDPLKFLVALSNHLGSVPSAHPSMRPPSKMSLRSFKCLRQPQSSACLYGHWVSHLVL